MKKIIALLLVTFWIDVSYARYQNVEDSAISYDFYNRDIVVNQDGSYHEIVEFKAELLKEQARNFAAKFPINYNGECQSVNIIEARTEINGKSYLLEKDRIEDKEIASNISGFDNRRQVSISFAKPEIKATIYLKYKISTHNIPIDNEFFGSYYLGFGGYWKNSTVTINSAIPLKLQINDPFKKLSIQTTTAKNDPERIMKARIMIKKPFTNDYINEVGGSVLSTKNHTYVSFTSLSSWKKLAEALSPKYDLVLNQDLPELFSDIIASSSKEKNIVDQINMVTTMLNKKVEYFGEWRSLKGKFVPQSFDIVAKKQSGDCKDFASLTTKILRTLGHEADVALVFRGEGYRQNIDPLPSLGSFNHAIVKLVDKSGKVYWIDPTNKVSMSDGIFPDIAEKYALVLEPKKAVYEQIPAVSAEHAKLFINKTIWPDKTIDVQMTFLGEQAYGLTAAELYISKESLENAMYSSLAINNIPQKNKIKFSVNPSLTSQNVKPIFMELKYKDNEVFSETNLGSIYVLNTDSLEFLKSITQIDVEKDVNDLYMRHPRVIQRKTIIKNVSVKDSHKLDVSINTPSLSLSRKFSAEGNDTVILEKLVVKNSWIKNQEFLSKEFKTLKNSIQKSFINTSIILQESKDI